MSSNWATCLLEEIASSDRGAIAIGPFGSRLKADAYVASGVRVIRGTNLNDGSGFSGEFVCISEGKASGLGNANVRPLDLVFPHRGNIGSVGLVPDDGKRYVLSTSMMKVTFDTEKVDPRFMYFFFRSDLGRQELLKNASQVGTPGIATPLTSLKACVVPIPPLHIQRDIATTLDALDQRINVLIRHSSILEGMARAIFESWFINFDPVRSKAEGREPEGMSADIAALSPSEFVDSELGPIPMGWSVGRLDDLLVLQRGFDLPATQRTAGDFPVLAASGPSGTHHISMAKGPGVTTGRSGVIGKVFYVHEDYWPLNTSLWVKEFKGVPPTYAFRLLAHIDLAGFNSGSAVPTLNRNHIHSLPVVLPPKPLVAAYDAIATDMLRRSKSAEDQADCLAKLREALLPKLLAGQFVFGEENG